MKKCPFCAEDIQDAAIVCKHCGRELQGADAGAVIVRRKPRNWGLFFAIVLLVVVGVPVMLLLLAYVGDSLHPSWRNTHISGECRLSGSARVVPVGAHEPGSLLLVNRDHDMWTNARLTIYGTIVDRDNLVGLTGAHTLARDLLLSGQTSVRLDDFVKADGSHWLPSSMRVDELEMSATLRGETCKFDQSFRE